jgi:HEAT repeat protein
MRAWQQWRSIRSRWPGVLGTALAILWVGVASADRFPSDPVEALRQMLKAPARNPAARAEALAKGIKELRNLGDLRRALLLQEWRDEEELDEALRKVDATNRSQVAKRFEEEVKDVLAHGTVTGKLAIAQMLGDQVLGEISQSAARSSRIRSNVSLFFGPSMAELTKSEDPPVRRAAARALGKMNAKPEIAVPALGDLLASADPADRMTALEGLLNLVTASQTISREPSEIVSTGQAVAPVAARALGDANLEVRRRAAETLYQVASALAKQVSEPRQRDESIDVEENRKKVRDDRTQLQPLITAIQEQAPALARALGDPDPTVRLWASQALEEIGNTRQRFQQLLESLPSSASSRLPDQPISSIALVAVTAVQAGAPEDPLLQALRQTLPALRRALTDPDVRVQLTVLDVLETLGPDAKPAGTELVQSLSSPNRFVRWAATRTLGKAGPVEVAAAVPELSRLLFDADLDLCLAAATALERFGPAAQEAVPALVRAVSATDAEMRLAAIRALEGIGTDAQPAIPALAAALADPDLRVRRSAAEVLGKFGPLARSAEPALRHTLNDSNAEVRQAASDALLGIMRGQ